MKWMAEVLVHDHHVQRLVSTGSQRRVDRSVVDVGDAAPHAEISERRSIAIIVLINLIS